MSKNKRLQAQPGIASQRRIKARAAPEQAAKSSGAKVVPRPTATHGFWIESDFELSSEWLPQEVFSKVYQDKSMAVATAIEGMIDDFMEVRVVDLSSGIVVWNSSNEKFA